MTEQKPEPIGPYPETIPEEIKKPQRWVLWRWEHRDGKWTKPPYQINGKPAKSNDPATWTDFETAFAAVQAGKADGIGFMLGDDCGFTGIDWDHCLDPKTGAIDPSILAQIEAIDSYTERSPSAGGFKTLVKGKLPGKGHHGESIGVFDTGRYFCITGDAWPETSAQIEPRQDELDALVRRYWPNDFKPTPAPAAISLPTDLSDVDLIDKALSANDGGKFRRLWEGDSSGYASASEADQALCNKLAFWTGRDAARIDALFRASGLMREKWNRDDYRERTIGKALAQSSEAYEPKGARQQGTNNTRDQQPDSRPSAVYHMTDTGNGQRFADQHRDEVRYSFVASKWFAWDGQRWKPDNQGAVRQLAKQTTRSIYREAAQEPDPEKSAKIGKWAAASESSFRQEAMLKLAQSEPGIPVLPDQLDTDPWLLNVLNGTVNLKTGELHPHRKSDLITKMVPVEYDPLATCERWLEFLATVTAKDEALTDYLRRVAGYAATGDSGEQCLFVFYGTGQNGKSTFLNVVQTVLDDYALQTGFDTFTVKKSEGIRNDIARMRSARMVVAIETGDGKRLDEQVVKQLTGGDKVTARFLHQEFFEYRPQFKVFLAANHKPTIYGQDHAIWRRIRLIPFTVKIPSDRLVRNYERVLLEEKKGILNWLVSGCMEWQRIGLADPDRVKAATEKYRSEMDVLEDFLADRCLLTESAKVQHGELYSAYEGWCEDNRETPFKTRTFAKMLESRGLIYTKPKNTKTWQGIGLRA